MIAPGAVGTSQLASNAVTSAQIAAGAVGSGQIAVGAVGNNQINASQVQLRVTGTCQAGEYMRGVNFNGSVICQPLSETLPTLNDTGINDCANGGTFASCPLANFPDQDGDYGRDARSRVGLVARFGGGEFGFDYNKISNSGNVVSASAALGTGATDWGCTRDNVSGLIWEVKLNNIASLRHMDHTYTWYDTNTTINGGNAGTVGTASTCNSTLSQCNTSAFVAAVNAQGLCGASNWRLPTREELQGILHYGRINPAIDPGYFPNTSASNNSATEWSGRNFAADASYAWVIDFYRGVVANQVKSRDSGVRLVRGVP